MNTVTKPIPEPLSDADRHRERLAEFLQHCTGHHLHEELISPWLNELLPGLFLLSGCDQGTGIHCEGDVAKHTALTFDNLIALAPIRLGRGADLVERLSAVIHDSRKPQTRVEHGDGRVTFPGHEQLALEVVFHLAECIALDETEVARLTWIVSLHSDANEWGSLPADYQAQLRASPWISSLALLQEADARACLYPDGSHARIYWREMVQLSPVR